MAATQSLLRRSLQLKANTGLDANNKPVYKTISFSKVKTNATPQAIFNVASAIANLMDSSVSQVLLADASDLIDA